MRSANTWLSRWGDGIFRRIGAIILAFGIFITSGWMQTSPGPTTEADPFEKIPVALFSQVESNLKALARLDARFLAKSYAQSNVHSYPGISAFGWQMVLALGDESSPVDFQLVVSRNPQFWLAERELNIADVSLPYFAAMLAILSDDTVTAMRLLSLTQACLPLTSTIRRVYAKPETLIAYRESMLLRGVPLANRLNKPEECDRIAQILRQRIHRWPRHINLLTRLISVTAQSANLQNATPAEWDISIQKNLGLTEAEIKYYGNLDPILSRSLEASVRQWLREETLYQKWSGGIEKSSPAEPVEIAESIKVYEANDRFELAWLTWRQLLVVGGLVSATENNRWKLWCRALLGDEKAAWLEKEAAKNPKTGTATLQVPFEPTSEAWSGDQGIHPMLVVQVERQLATIYAKLAMSKDQPSAEAQARFSRVELFYDIGAIGEARVELERYKKIGPERITKPQVRKRYLRGVDELESAVLIAEKRYDDAKAALNRLARIKDMQPYWQGSAELWFILSDFEQAKNSYLQLFAIENDPEYSPYWAIMADIAARRLDGRELKALHQERAKAIAGSWIETGLKFSLGEISEDQLLKIARTGPLFTVIQQECEASFWIAQYALAENDQTKGIAWLRKCVATGFSKYLEYKLAKAELERLAPKSDAPSSEKRHSRSSYRVEPA